MTPLAYNGPCAVPWPTTPRPSADAARRRSRPWSHFIRRGLLALGAALVCASSFAGEPPVSALRVVVPADAAPAAIATAFGDFELGGRSIDIPGAAWLQLKFSKVVLGDGGELVITDETGQSQTFDQRQIEAWNGLTAVFRGHTLRIDVKPGRALGERVFASVGQVIVGVPASAMDGTDLNTRHPLATVFGPDVRRFLPADVRAAAERREASAASTESICGTTDERVASSNPRVGRIMPVGCTGWLLQGDRVLTAGHCIGSSSQILEFNVPSSRSDGTTVPAAVRDQYRIDTTSIRSVNGGTGADWALMRVLPNTETGVLPSVAQGAVFGVSNSTNPTNVRITGYGVDGPAPLFGDGVRNAQSQTQQTDVSSLLSYSGGASTGTLQYSADTQPANSGSPVVGDGSDIAIGIHTTGGCTSSGGVNKGTSFRNAALWNAISHTSVWRYTGVPCTSSSCPGWLKLDHSGNTVRITAGGGNVYELRSNGEIMRYGGAPCTTTSCSGWVRLDNNPATIAIAADGANLYQLHNTGRIWKYTGSTWQMLDANPATLAIVASGGQLYQLHNDGRIWRFTGTGCTGSACPGWQLLDANPATVSIAAGGGSLYQLHSNGKVWRYTGGPSWELIDSNTGNIGIAAGSALNVLRSGGTVVKFISCGTGCWTPQTMDWNPATVAITADNANLYLMHNTGAVFKSLGPPCDASGKCFWQQLDGNPLTGRISAAGGYLYQLHGPRTAMTRARVCQDCR